MKKYMFFVFITFLSIEINHQARAAAAAEDIDIEGQQRQQAKSRQQVEKKLTPEQEALGKELVNACIEGDVEKVKGLIARGAPLGVYGLRGTTALTASIRYGWWEIFKILLNAGADVNQRENEDTRDTPLLVAVDRQEKRLKYIRALISRGAHVNIPDKDGIAPLELVASFVPLADTVDILNTLIGGGAFIDQQDIDGDSALMGAIDWGNYPAARELILVGANPDLANKKGETAWALINESKKLESAEDKKRMEEAIAQALEEREQRARAVRGHLPRELASLVTEGYMAGRKPGPIEAGSVEEEEKEEEEKKESSEESEYAARPVDAGGEARARRISGERRTSDAGQAAGARRASSGRRGGFYESVERAALEVRSVRGEEGLRPGEAPQPNPETGFYD